ncbi:M48 family metalloprotease [Leptolyngbya cf. ectocarpi LEGE 11479]|uniref:M48 family metalloprotease n=2 Tax=Leptolyngbya ectocarpi TaxID=1202 RepID=A0A929FC31_LEPEC|nr:M48 family metalloprotease [Leptolyngbya cf. ectocarpi LEGE 11479]
MDLERSPDQLIKAGLAALKHKDYGRAIALFQQLHQADDTSTAHRLKAQMGLIRVYAAQGATQQAQALCQPLLKNRSQTIRQWAQEQLHQLASTASQDAIESGANPSSTSGFVPEATGFIPLTPNNAAADVGENIATSPSSLFHYQTLNSERKLSAIDTHAHGSSAEANSSATPSPRQVAPAEKFNQPPPQPPRARASKVTTDDGPHQWPQGDRLSTLKSLGKVNGGPLWIAQLVTVPMLFFVVRWLWQVALAVIRSYLQFLDRLLPLDLRPASFFWQPHTWAVLICLSLLTIAAPWLWPLWLRPAETVTSTALEKYSPEAVQLLRRFCNKRRWPLPKIQLLTSDLPIIVSYGWRPRYGRLVVSQGLLDGLAPDELAAIIMYEMSHWSNWDWVFFSTHGLLLQSCHRVYWFLARWGESRPFILKNTAGTFATLSYGIFWLLAQVGCGLARTRIPYRDRSAAELTGNPNGLVRALAKLSLAMGKAVQTQGYTPPLLESLELMLPVSPDESTSIQQFAWGAFNPLRHWLSINQGHPPLGDRLYTLSAYGRHWRLKPSLNFAQLSLKQGPRHFSRRDWQTLLMQGGAWSGLVVGLGVALLMWLVGAIATSLDFPLLAWLHRDFSILVSMPLIGAATGQLLRINTFFPEIAPSLAAHESQLTIGQTNPKLTPLSSIPIKINGTLTGRPLLANWLGQEWRLRTSYGSIKLHHTSYFGPLSNLMGLNPLRNQSLQVTGWLRRGHHLWIDIERLRTPRNHITLAQHPSWSFTISFLLLGYGLWIMFRGG